MKMKYKICVIEKHSGIVEVEAEDLDEAYNIATEKVEVSFDCVYDYYRVSGPCA